jgi:hypothetical protein
MPLLLCREFHKHCRFLGLGTGVGDARKSRFINFQLSVRLPTISALQSVRWRTLAQLGHCKIQIRPTRDQNRQQAIFLAASSRLRGPSLDPELATPLGTRQRTAGNTIPLQTHGLRRNSFAGLTSAESPQSRARYRTVRKQHILEVQASQSKQCGPDPGAPSLVRFF